MCLCRAAVYAQAFNTRYIVHAFSFKAVHAGHEHEGLSYQYGLTVEVDANPHCPEHSLCRILPAGSHACV